MNTHIHHIETLVPAQRYAQTYARDLMMKWVGDPKRARHVRMVYNRSGIDYRHSVLPDFTLDATKPLFRTDESGRLDEPSTEERNRCYIRHCREMVVELAKRAVKNTPGIVEADITHVVTVSCTGFYNPGPDVDIVLGLGLADTVERYHIGFMGCYAAFPALRMARQFCQANPRAVVLVVCLELCSLHLQVRDNADSLLANALFSDGGAAAVVSGLRPTGDQPTFLLHQFLSAMAPEGGGDMAWEIGNHGFNMVLSGYIPAIIAANISPIVDNILVQAGLDRDDVDLWAVHPGGKAILDKIEQALSLAPEQLEPPREVLRNYGNMSSATILFVLRHLLQSGAAPAESRQVCAMAFGPGLTIETALLELRPGRQAVADATAGARPANANGELSAF